MVSHFKIKMCFEVWQCQHCGSYALAIDGERVAGPNCKIWNGIEDLSFKVSIEKMDEKIRELRGDKNGNGK